MYHIFPTKFVYWEKISNHEEIKSQILNIVNQDVIENGVFYTEKIKNSWNCECTSSFFNENNYFHGIMNADILKQIIWDSFDNMLIELRKTLGLPIPKSSKITKIWFNQYKSGEWQEIHGHNGIDKSSTYSGIYLLDLNEKNPTTFVDQNPIRCWDNFSSFTLNTFSTKDMEEGTVMFFPSELLHYVNPCITDRTTISFNIDSTFE